MKKFATSFLSLLDALCFAVPVFAATQVGIVLPTKDEPRWLQDEARISHTLVCPMADIWKAYGERGFETLSIKLYFYLLETAEESFKDRGRAAVARALKKMAEDGVKRAKETAAKYEKHADETLFFETCPICLSSEIEPIKKIEIFCAPRLSARSNAASKKTSWSRSCPTTKRRRTTRCSCS